MGSPGGPIDMSLLTRYQDYVARHIWFGQERIDGPKPELRIASLGVKLTNWVDPQLLSAFTERWHAETSSFHIPFGEMTITLDDVPCLLHILVRGVFHTPVSVSMEGAAALAAELAYMLSLVECTILTDKTYTRVNAKWLPMFRDLFTLNRFSWASAALVCLYDNLNDASMFATRALAGVGFTSISLSLVGMGKMKLPTYRPIMDALTPSDVIWRPFEGHRGSVLFDLVTCFRGYLRGWTTIPYLPQRCLRQFGFLQYIPPSPPHAAPSYDDIDSLWSGYHTYVDRILQLTLPVTYDDETTSDYLSWYYTVSHPRVCRPHDRPHGAPPVPQYVSAQQDDPTAEDAPPADAPPESSQQGEKRWRHVVVSALERYVAYVDADRDDDTFEDIVLALDVAHGDRDID
ncbi:hypothetical protein TSUD_404530 [Trifolium subterraneum]|uniref:Aminotransferase-like plant mobile domain-containing protein n=1 Tax=Trifolium subterraneum TaxID=3900 RepID=A0A2Z6NUM5_TRISU|nr:hypothetical protein TSUD_404530 [Trifolium subterraneum]